jgi:chlorobactene lauroyltransferase
MLKAKKSVWFEEIFALYNRNLFKRRFHSLQISNLEVLKERREQAPLIIYANHSSWWDGLVAFEVSRAAALDAYIMMEEKQLKKLFPFRLLGAFSVVRENPRQALQSIKYAAELLKNSSRVLWVFPQGRILPNDARPITFYNGVSRIIEKLGACSAVSLAMQYEFRGEFKPEIFVKIGDAEFFKTSGNLDSKKLTNRLEDNLTQIADELKSDALNNNFAAYSKIF